MPQRTGLTNSRIRYVKAAAEPLPKLNHWRTLLAYICEPFVGQVGLPKPPPQLPALGGLLFWVQPRKGIWTRPIGLRCVETAALLRQGQEAFAFARHKQPSGPFVSGLSLAVKGLQRRHALLTQRSAAHSALSNCRF